MIILGVETSSQRSSVALSDADGRITSTDHEGRRHVEFVMPAIMDLLGDRTLGDVERIAVGLGPGQFTGMRAGIATAKTIAWTLGIPIVGVSTHEQIATAGDGIAVVDAGRGQVYAARCGGGDLLEQITLVAIDDLPRDARLFGSAPLEGITEVLPNAATVCRLGALREPTAVAQIEPLYVRRSDAEINWEARGGVIQRPDRVQVAKRIAELVERGDS